MNRLKTTALLGMAALLLAPSPGRAAATLQPAYGKVLADDVRLKPQPAQGSYANPNQGPPPKNAPAPRKAAPSGPGSGKPNYAAPGPGRPDSYRRGDYRRGPGYGPRHVGPPGRAYYRPWGHRPYYGRIIGGIALGTIIGVTAYGLIPPRPAPDLCWYWADPYRSRGYWDYCD
jgi:hypothetical protein